MRPAPTNRLASSFFAERSGQLERITLRGCLVAAAVVCWLLALPLIFGHELDCFPRFEQPVRWVAAAGVLAVVVSLVAGLCSAVAMFHFERRVSMQLVLGLWLATVAVAAAPIANQTLWVNFGSHTDGCGCEPDGILGSVSPSAWKAIYEAASAGSIRRSDWFDPYFRPPAKPNCTYLAVPTEDCDPWAKNQPPQTELR